MFSRILGANKASILIGTSSASGIVIGYLFVNKENNYAFDFSSLFSGSKLTFNDCLTNTITSEQLLNDKRDLAKSKMEAFITNLQGQFVKELEKFEPEKRFHVDRWLRKEGGGGITCSLEDGETFERAGVNVSVVNGILPVGAVEQMRARYKFIIY
jgi:coproporphyrinogen III oxidase